MTAGAHARAPVIVGVGQVIGRDGDSDEPLALALEALRLAGEDSGAGDTLLRRADSVRCVPTTGWPYTNQAALLADKLGAHPRDLVETSRFGGDGPQRLIGDTAQAIADGRLDVALVSGAEAIATVMRCQKRGERPPWPDPPSAGPQSRVLGSDRNPANEVETAAGLLAPVYAYALIESALRARTGADRETHLERIAALWSRFSAVGAGNAYAWLPRVFTPDELATPSADNRPVSDPYLKLLTANLQVDLATGLILCSAEAAESAGVPKDRWIFLWAGAHATDEWHLSERAELAASPAIRACGRAAFEHAAVAADDLTHVDLYSCFPSAVQIGAAELGLPLDDRAHPLTVTGGLTFAGGPGNNYSSHAVATLVPLLREDPRAIGLTTALGWYVTKHALNLYSASPPARSYRDIAADELVERPPPRPIASAYSGPATLEAYTIPYGRDGEPEAAVISTLTPDGSRCLVRSSDPDLIELLVTTDPLGEEIAVEG